MPTVFEYEIEFTVRNKANGGMSSRTTREFAYTLMDAMHQASLTIDQSEEIVKFCKIGPPKELIEAIAKETQNMIQNALKRFNARE